MSLQERFLFRSAIFFDFDGVIKDSVEAKSEVFEHLFSPFGSEIARKVRKHHEINTGVSRYEKFPLYLVWAGLEPNEEIISEYSDKFSSLVVQRVIESDWVPGIINFLRDFSERARLFVVTATPQAEIEEILKQLAIENYFTSVIGAPTPKGEGMQLLMENFSINAEQAIMVGDSKSDYLAAKANKVDLILRRTKLNKKLQRTIGGAMISDFTDSGI